MKKNKDAKIGRPKMPPGTANTVLFAFKIAANEAQRIHTAVKRSGLSKAQWAREKLLAAAGRA